MNTSSVKSFYESFPYPSKKILTKKHLYDNCYWVAKLVNKKPTEFRKSDKILEAGCGTGEFSCGFALSGASVLGIDLSKNSLSEARILAKKFSLKNVSFKQMNLLQNNLTPNSFDYIFSMGVLHHNQNPKEAFNKLAVLLKSNGFIVIGLYNKYSRFPVKLKRIFVSFFAKDPEKRILLANKLFHQNKSLTKSRRIWLMDKYCHPLEKTVSFSEVLSWFRGNNISFLSSNPKVNSLNKLHLLSAQLSWTIKEKNFFVVAGRKI